EDLVSVYTYLWQLAKNEPATVGQNDKVTQGAAIWCDATHACPTGPGYSCHMDATFGNECVGNVCADDSGCGACQHCDGTNHCVAPDPVVALDQACVNGGI